MFKVMIVDDEIYVVALIKKLVDWEKFQMTVEGTANDGITALAMVKEISPDLVIVDIRMPGYDGIAFMDKVREFNSNVRFIVISGHKQFDYAKGAMRNNVEDYLLKPINKEELEAVIANVYDKLKADQKKEYKLKEMEEELDSSKKRIQELMVQSIMKREYKGLEQSLDEINEHYLTEFEEGEYRMLSLILDAPAVNGKGHDNDLMIREARQELGVVLGEVCFEILDVQQGNHVYFLINYKRERQAEVINILQKQMAQYDRRVKKFENVFFRMCVGDSCNELFKIDSSQSGVWQCMISRTAMPEGKLIRSNDLKTSDVFLDAVFEYREDRLEQALTALNIEEISRCIREMYTKAFYGIEEDSLLYYKLYIKLKDRIYQYFYDIGVCSETKNEYHKRLEKRYLEAANASEYPRILCREVETFVKENQLSKRGQEAPAIRIVKRYIREHYKEDISLSMLADMVHISPVYLSRLFKKEEGINFLDYLNQYRIEVSKKLLQDISCNIIEVAEQSGFNNTKYFSRIFKKAVGITPSEYRKRHLGKDEL